jgi:hypothetical protein
MFLDSGDGIVFKGAVGDWFDSTTEEYHLTEEAAKALMTMAVDAYKDKHDKKPPAELFIHGQTRFNWREWKGFSAAVDERTKLVGVRIRDDKGLKLFRKTDNPGLRGTAYISTEKDACGDRGRQFLCFMLGPTVRQFAHPWSHHAVPALILRA